MSTNLVKGAKYIRYGLDLVLLNPDYQPVGNVHYVQAKCNKCGNKVKLLRGDWVYDGIKACPGCKGNNTSGSTTIDDKKKVTRTTKPKAEVKAQSQEKTVSQMFLVGNTLDNCKITHTRGDMVELTCNKCKRVFELSRSRIIGIAQSKGRLCGCSDMQKMDIGLIQRMNPAEVSKRAEKAQRELPGWIYKGTRLVGERGNLRYMYRCATCGRAKEFATLDKLMKFDGVCDKCEKIKNSKMIPLTKMDWVGYTTKCRTVVRTYENDQNIKMAEVKCLLCGNTEDIALASVITGDMDVCEKCAVKPLQLLCPVCQKVHLKNNLSGLYSEVKSDIICMNENKKIPKDELLGEHEFRIRMQYIKSKYKNKFKFSRKTDGANDKAGLIVFDSGYTGRNGEEYHNCMCPQHNKFLCLTEQEIEEYRHDFCMNFRMIPAFENKQIK